MKLAAVCKPCFLTLSMLALTIWPPTGDSAQPTSAQRSAIRNACQSDFMKYCSSVTPGGADALACLKKNLSSLSSACQTAVGAVSGNAGGTSKPASAGGGGASSSSVGTAATKAPAPAATQPEPTVVVVSPVLELRVIRNACARDYRALCSGVPLGGGRVVGCLKQHAASLSSRCKGALSAL